MTDIWLLTFAVESSWNVMAHGDTREGKWRENWRMERVSSTLHTISEHGVSSITTADPHTSAASSRLNWRPRRFKWTVPFRSKTKFGFCACAIIFQTQSTAGQAVSLRCVNIHAFKPLPSTVIYKFSPQPFHILHEATTSRKIQSSRTSVFTFFPEEGSTYGFRNLSFTSSYRKTVNRTTQVVLSSIPVKCDPLSLSKWCYCYTFSATILASHLPLSTVVDERVRKGKVDPAAYAEDI